MPVPRSIAPCRTLVAASASCEDRATLPTLSSLWSGPETEHSPSLRFLHTHARAEISVEDARAAGLEDGDEATLTAQGTAAETTVAVRTGVPAGSAFVSGVSLPAGPVRLTPARVPVEAVAAREVKP